MAIPTCETIGESLIAWLESASPTQIQAFCTALADACERELTELEGEFIGYFTNAAGSRTYYATDAAVAGQFYEFLGQMFYIVKDVADLRAKTVLWDVADAPDEMNIAGDSETFSITANQLITTRLTDMTSVLKSRKLFNQPIGAWDTRNVTNMRFALSGLESFDQEIGGWDMSNVTSVWGLCEDVKNFTADLNSWDLSSLVEADHAFRNMRGGSPLVDKWYAPNMASASHMFYNSSGFDQDLSGWCVPKIPSRPANFAAGTPIANQPSKLPVWGTCP